MGGTPTYLIPAAYTGMSSFRAHIEDRDPSSSEPGTDYYMPTGTPLRAPARGRVVAVGGSIYPATGRYVVIDDGHRWLRFLHLSEWKCRVGDDLEAGEIFALSGASGYGSEFFGEPSRNSAFWRNTGGDHVHVTAFEGRGYPAYWNGSGTVDFHALTGGKVASGSNAASTPAEPEEEDEDMPKNSGVWYKKDKSTYVYLVFNTGSGFAHEFSNGANAGTMPGNYTAGLKAAMEIAGWSEVTPGHAQVIKNGLAAVRPKDAPKEIEVTIVSQAELDALDA